MLEISVTDTSDWLNTKAPYLSTIESALRCHICKEFLSAPMLTSCSHTFCSLCIRRQLNESKKCPTCRTEIQTSSLRKNTTIEELVENYVKNRDQLLELVGNQEQAIVVEEKEEPRLRRSTRKRR